ncbi:histidinol-phosphate transaminase [Bacillus sp. JJ1521]|uniref:histidinol-phosphate transaminase n=1 Tax=Bacillus sp. JJ1521 TaxID=3122957 RepID=UPI002FFE4F60
MTRNLFRKGIDKLTPYVPGKPIEDVKREYGVKEITRLASNENPFGPSPKAIEEMKKTIGDSWLYPEPSCRTLREKLAVLNELSIGNFVVGNGADHLITMVGNAFINDSDEIIYCTPTFTSYREITLLMGGIPVEIPLTKDYVYDLDSILAAVTERTKLIFICNPNNPTGTIVQKEKLEWFLTQLPEHVIVVLDEAYVEFIRESDYTTGTELIKAGHRIIALRTFSKLYGLAGARVGYAIGKEKILAPLRAVRQTFAVNRFGIAGAEATLDDLNYSNEVLQHIQKEVTRITKEFQALDYEVVESHANFIFMDVKEDASKVSDYLLRKGLIIRPCKAWGLNTHIRVTVGTQMQNDNLIIALKEMKKIGVV